LESNRHDEWGMVDNKHKLESDIKRQETLEYMKKQKKVLNVKDLNTFSVGGAVRDLYIEKMAGEQSDKKPLGNISSKVGLKSNNLAQLKPI